MNPLIALHLALLTLTDRTRTRWPPVASSA